jgi:hypothetical protein
VLVVLFRFTDSDYPFGILKLPIFLISAERASKYRKDKEVQEKQKEEIKQAKEMAQNKQNIEVALGHCVGCPLSIYGF